MNLNNAEKIILERVAAGDDKLLARRAIIILMSDGQAQPENIAKEVELTTRTVKRWQREFEKKRLQIFPKDVLNGDDPLPPATPPPTAQSPASVPGPEPQTAPKSAKSKLKKVNKSVKYPTRKTIGLQPTDTLAEAGRKILGFHFARMLKHEPGTRQGEDIEALHNMRVATRRMRSAFNIFGPAFSKKAIKPLKEGLKETGGALGPVRDLDVFMEKLEQYLQTLPENQRDSLQILMNIWQSKRERARENMLAYLDSKKYLKFKQQFLQFVKNQGMGVKPIPTTMPPTPHQLRHLAPELIYTAYHQVRAYETILDNAPIETLHQLRLSFKRLRYVIECLQEILGEEKKAVIEDVKAMQDHLGHLNDADTASKILQEFLADWEEHQRNLPLAERQSPAQIAAYLEVKLSERHQLLISFADAWTRFNRPEFRLNLARAMTVL